MRSRKMKYKAMGLMALAYIMAASPAHANWYKGQTHIHTLNSDGNAAPDEAARWYREHGYDFIFITDHEYVTDVAPLNALFGAEERFLVLPGQEITQWTADPKRRGPHVNGLFLEKRIWPMGERRCMGSGCGATAAADVPTAETYRVNIGAILAAGAIAQVNHPNGWWTTKPEDLFAIPDRTLLEIWNASGANNLGGSDEEGNSRPSGEGFWDILLSRGKIVWGVGTDDAHDYSPEGSTTPGAPGRAWIVVRADELSGPAIRKSLNAGDFYASTGVGLSDIIADAKSLTIKIGRRQNDDRRLITRFIGKDGKLLKEMAGFAPSYSFAPGDVYVRAVITDSNGQQAWTQPVFLDRRGQRPR